MLILSLVQKAERWNFSECMLPLHCLSLLISVLIPGWACDNYCWIWKLQGPSAQCAQTAEEQNDCAEWWRRWENREVRTTLTKKESPWILATLMWMWSTLDVDIWLHCPLHLFWHKNIKLSLSIDFSVIMPVLCLAGNSCRRRLSSWRPGLQRAIRAFRAAQRSCSSSRSNTTLCWRDTTKSFRRPSARRRSSVRGAPASPWQGWKF